MKRESDDAPDSHVLARLFHALAVDPHMARVDQRLRERAALHESDEEEEAVDPQR